MMVSDGLFEWELGVVVVEWRLLVALVVSDVLFKSGLMVVVVG